MTMLSNCYRLLGRASLFRNRITPGFSKLGFRSFGKPAADNIPRPHSGIEYLQNVVNQTPTEFGSEHPSRRVASQQLEGLKGGSEKQDTREASTLRRHKPVTRRSASFNEAYSDIDTSYLLYRPVWSEEQIQKVNVTRHKPECLSDWVAKCSLTSLKELLNLACGYTTSRIGLNKFGEKGWLYRITFLETVAGIPGFVGAMARHCASLREMRRDHGWIHTLLEEAENERMHLLVCLNYLEPNLPFRALVVSAQMVMFTMWGITYFCSPRLMHRMVGYLEEEAVSTYKDLIQLIDDGHLPGFQKQAKPLGIKYWNLPKDATIRDVFAQMCADEANHRLVNHKFADLTRYERKTGIRQANPFRTH